MRKRRRFAPEFKAKVALEALAGEHTLAEIATKHDILSLPETRSFPLSGVPTTVFRVRGMRNRSLEARPATKNLRRRQRLSGLEP